MSVACGTKTGNYLTERFRVVCDCMECKLMDSDGQEWTRGGFQQHADAGIGWEKIVVPPGAPGVPEGGSPLLAHVQSPL